MSNRSFLDRARWYLLIAAFVVTPVARIIDANLFNTGGVLIVILPIVLIIAAIVGFVKHRTERDYSPSPDDPRFPSQHSDAPDRKE